MLRNLKLKLFSTFYALSHGNFINDNLLKSLILKKKVRVIFIVIILLELRTLVSLILL